MKRQPVLLCSRDCFTIAPHPVRSRENFAFVEVFCHVLEEALRSRIGGSGDGVRLSQRWSGRVLVPPDKAYLVVKLPVGAKLIIGTSATLQTGPERHFLSPPLQPGKKYAYDLTATWMENGKPQRHQRVVPVMPASAAWSISANRRNCRNCAPRKKCPRKKNPRSRRR